MDKRFVLFIVLSVAILLGNAALMSWLRGPPEPDPAAVAQADPAEQPADVGALDAGPDAEEPADDPNAEADPPDGDADAAAEQPAQGQAQPGAKAQQIPEQWLTLGSADPESDYRMLVHLTNRGAAIPRIELNDPRYRNLDHDHGYLGELAAIKDEQGRGCLVRVVGAGTPAAKAGLEPGDIITRLNQHGVSGPLGLEAALLTTKPNQPATIEVLRNGATLKREATLAWPPLEIIRPEGGLDGHDPYSLLLTFNQIDGRSLDMQNEELLDAELPGVELRNDTWEVLPRNDPNEVVFRKLLDKEQLEVRKRFRLAKVDPALRDDETQPAYHLEFDVEIINRGTQAKTVAYQLDGPTGLPDEGWWYASKIGRDFWGSAGLRDIATGTYKGVSLTNALIPGTSLAEDDKKYIEEGNLLYVGVDGQFFAAILIPKKEAPVDRWFARSRAMRVGDVPPKAELKRLNVTCRLVSQAHALAPAGEKGASLSQGYTVFVGPKRPGLLAKYEILPDVGLDELVYYGWYGWVARPMLAVLHFFYGIVGNYGIAIIMLTVLVRSCMFPISKKQAQNAARMQELQPELKRIGEKHKGNMEARNKAMQELYKKHNFHPLAGCLPVFFQLPIFIGLYRSLSVDVELRQAALIPGLDWCSNLAAPDMLFNWSGFMPGFLINWLGPYFNVLPCITIALFIWQQKMFMPPPTDEQSRLQQKMMKYMMIFMGVMFFKVASGLCIYFIASSLWGIAERKLMPKPTPPGGQPQPAARPPVAATTSSNGASENRPAKKKQR